MHDEFDTVHVYLTGDTQGWLTDSVDGLKVVADPDQARPFISHTAARTASLRWFCGDVDLAIRHTHFFTRRYP